jgi:SET domain-containing protein 6
MTTSFEETGKAFWQWLENNGATLSKDIKIKDYRSEGAGRGIVATKDIKV